MWLAPPKFICFGKKNYAGWCQPLYVLCLYNYLNIKKYIKLKIKLNLSNLISQNAKELEENNNQNNDV